MLPPSQIDAIAAEIRAARREVRQVEPFSARIPGFDLDCAYAVAAGNHRAALAEGAVPVGRKIGFTNPDMWALHGVREPIWSHVYDRTVARLPEGGGRCPVGRYTEPRIEPEIILHFRAAPPPGAGAADILACLDWVAHGFEMVQSHFPGWRFAAPDTVADMSLHATLLVGEPVPVARLGAGAAAALADFSLSLSRDGVVQETGRGSNVLGSPLLALVHLAGLLERQGAPLAAGELVTTGTVTRALPVLPGETWTTALDGIPLPGLTLEIVA